MARAVAMLLAVEGASAVTHQRVAELAGVGRATLYRHWPTAADLLYDVLSEIDEPVLLRPGRGPLDRWLRQQLRRAGTDLGQPNALQVQAVLISRSSQDPEAAELRARLVKRNLDVLAGALDDARRRGELRGNPDPLDLLGQLLGPVIFRVVFEGRPATAEFVDAVVECALAPWTRAPGS